MANKKKTKKKTDKDFDLNLSFDKKVYVVNKEDDSMEFVIEISEDNTTYRLCRSNSETWSERSRGEILLVVVNTGNDLTFMRPGDPTGSMSKFDYSEAHEMMIMLDYLDKSSNYPSSFIYAEA